MEETITMTSQELGRYEIVSQLIAGTINGTVAAKQLNLSVRQTKRLKSKVINEGAKGIQHGLKNTPGNHKIAEKVKKKAKKQLKKTYADFGPTLAAEKLEELHQIKLGVSTVRKLMIDEKLFTPKSRKTNKEYRAWRERKDCYGELEQFDGCYHHWFEKRGPECCLLASIDDATGKPTRLEFRGNESTKNVFGFWKEYVEEKGKPIAIYLDKYSTYKINHKSAVDNPELLTQFQRAANDLGIRLITAHSPQAKGRVERLFETLQDRLVKELRLRKINDVASANKFLKEQYIEDFSQKFGVVPKKEQDLHQPLTKIDKADLDKIFSVQSKRKVYNDFTFQFKSHWYQLAETQPTTVFRKDSLLIEERLDGTIQLSKKGKYLVFEALPARPLKVKMQLAAITPNKAPWKPPINHPWRKQITANVRQKQIISNP